MLSTNPDAARAARLEQAFERIEKMAAHDDGSPRYPAILEIAADALTECRDPATGQPWSAA